MKTMQMAVESVPGQAATTILGLIGELDASNFESVIAKAEELYSSGTRRLLVDMGKLNFMSSSGLLALHSIISLMQGGNPPDPQAGWAAFHAIDRECDSSPQSQVKLVNPQPKVLLSLQKTGIDKFFEIYTNRQTALASL